MGEECEIADMPLVPYKMEQKLEEKLRQILHRLVERANQHNSRVQASSEINRLRIQQDESIREMRNRIAQLKYQGTSALSPLPPPPSPPQDRLPPSGSNLLSLPQTPYNNEGESAPEDQMDVDALH